MDVNNFIFTSENKCRGCNKCILRCPVHANSAIWVNEENKVLIKDGFCISCGECLDVCDHNSRDFIDDTATFFEDLENGQSVSLLVAPSIYTNIPNMNKLFGFFKSKGVNLIYDVSFGADICTWGYIKSIKEKNIKTMIAQPCPVIVSYIEKFRPSLIDKLSPVHSPVMCAAVYMKKYKNIDNKLAFISPCIGKKREFIDKNTHQYINYNVTIDKLLSYLEDNNINLDNYPEVEFDNMKGSLGFAFPRPGGFAENVRFYLEDDVWIKRIEGIIHIEKYFDEYEADLEKNNPVPLIIDVLNCEHGCNIGTGTRKDASHNRIDYLINQKKKQVSPEEGKKLLEYFDDNLNIDDFTRYYTDKSKDYVRDKNLDLEDAFIELGKFTEEDRSVNCFSCGYGSCKAFAKALANEQNHVHNCMKFVQNRLKNLSYIDDLTGINNRHSYNECLRKFSENEPTSLGVLYADINELKLINDTKGHKEGDKLITSLAKMLRKVFHEKIYRIGGDEFIVLDSDVGKVDFEKKVSVFSQMLSKQENLKISIGSSWSNDCKNIIKQIEMTDSLMYMDKQKYYGSEGNKIKYKEMLSANLRLEIQGDKFTVYLQPQIDLHSKKIAGAEALVRKFDENNRIVPPLSFIPFYEKEGIIPILDFFVFETVCRYLVKWKEIEQFADMKVSVNFSRESLKAEGTIQKIVDICKEFDVDPKNIMIEVTESIQGVNEDELSQLVSKFSSAGFSISLDDFGMGHSNLAILSKSEFHEIKIDKSLVDNITVDPKTRVLVKHVLSLCQELNIPITLAEGIEDEEQYEILKEFKCVRGQGYFFDKPLPLNDFMEKYT